METVSKFIGAVIALIIGIAFLSQISLSEQGLTQKTNTASELHNVLSTIETGRNNTMVNATIVYTLTNAPTGWKVTDCPITNMVLTNSTGSVLAEGASNGYVFTASAGTFVLRDTAGTLAFLGTSNNTYSSYTYCGDNYMSQGWGRTGLDLVPGMFAIALMIISVGLFYSVYQDWK